MLNKKKGKNMAKDSVALRQRTLKTGYVSLYLDIYAGGKRNYEYLKLYLVPELTREDKAKNKETLRLAEAIRAKRVVEVHNEIHGFASKGRDVPLCGYIELLAEEKFGHNKKNLLANLKRFSANYEKIKVSDVDEKFAKDFIAFLRKSKLKQNSINTYFAELKITLNNAIRDKIISVNKIKDVSVKREETHREHLSVDELKAFADAEATGEYEEEVKRAFVFSCLCGLRRSDISNLKWGNISDSEARSRISLRMQKTKGIVDFAIHEQARQILGERQSDEILCFPFFAKMSNATISKKVGSLAKKAGITRHLTFHCARHTFACLMLDVTDLYTVFKLLGHSNVSTTQIYAKVSDKKISEAVSAFEDMF